MKQGKGTVGVENDKGRLRLRLPRHLFGGKQVYLALLLADTKTNRKIAGAKAGAIEADIVFERFDFTLEKYKAPAMRRSTLTLTTLLELWDKYTEIKVPYLSPTSERDFRKVRNHILDLPFESPAQAKSIVKYCRDNLTADTTRRLLTQFSACCDWAVTEELLPNNPFLGLKKYIRSPIAHSIKPFSKEEMDLIIESFESAEEHRHYSPLVKFFFLTGCRTSEAVGLKWSHISPDFTFIDFSEAVVEGHRKPTKTRKSRRFPVNESLRSVLVNKIRTDRKMDAPVFTDSQGGLVRPNNFLRRHWQPIVKSLDIAYKPQYNTRHTFITLCLESGIPVTQVAAWVGNSPRVIWEHYAGFIPSNVPEF